MNIDFISIISITLLSSFGHCYAMCGGFNLAFLELNKKSKNIFLLSIFYHFSRILAYIILGLIFWIFGFVLNFLFKGFLLFIIGFFMIILGIAMIFKGKLLYIIENNNIISNIINNFIFKAIKLKGIKGAILLGFLNGMIPCGLVYFFLALSLSKTNIIEAILIMLVFGISTLPALLFFNELTKTIKQRLKIIFTNFSYILIMIYGVYLMYLGLISTNY